MSGWTEIPVTDLFHTGKPLAERIFTAELQIRPASVLDIQRQELPEDVWDKKDGKYVLKDSYRLNIIHRALRFMKKALNIEDTSFVKGIYLVSSIGTYFYSDTTDIDVKIVIDLDELHRLKPGLKNFSEDILFEYLVSEMRDDSFMTSPLPGSERPFDWYVYEYSKFIDYRDRKSPRFDSIYDVVNNKWYKFTPKIQGLGDTEIYKYAVELAQKIFEDMDIKLGKLRRYAMDYDYFLSYLRAINPNSIDVKKELDKTITAIEDIMEEISADKSMYHDLRKKAFDEEKIVDTYAKVYNSVNFSDANLTRKILEHYGYWFTLVSLSKLWEKSEEKVKPKFIKELGKIIREI
jgi:hypothetical protein